jgi:hypothetical protein
MAKVLFRTPEGDTVFCEPAQAQPGWERVEEAPAASTLDDHVKVDCEVVDDEVQEDKGQPEDEEMTFEDLGEGRVKVTTPGGEYMTTPDRCECEDFKYRVARGLKWTCKHLKARREAGFEVSLPAVVEPVQGILPRGRIERTLAAELNFKSIILGSDDGEGKGILWDHSDRIGDYPTASLYDILLGGTRDFVTIEILAGPEITEDPLSGEPVVYCKVRAKNIKTGIEDEGFVYEVIQPGEIEKGVFNNVAQRAMRHARRNAIANLMKAPKGKEAVNYVRGMIRAYKQALEDKEKDN